MFGTASISNKHAHSIELHDLERNVIYIIGPYSTAQLNNSFRFTMSCPTCHIKNYHGTSDHITVSDSPSDKTYFIQEFQIPQCWCPCWCCQWDETFLELVPQNRAMSIVSYSNISQNFEFD